MDDTSQTRSTQIPSVRYDVAVIGAGIVGAATALELAGRGVRVALIEPAAPGGEQAASYGNGAFLSPGSVIPMSLPGLWRKVPGYLMDRTGPLTINPADLPRLAPWLLAFMRAGSTMEKVTRTAQCLRALIGDGPDRHLALAERIGRPELIVQEGLLHAFPDAEAFRAEAAIWALRRDCGLRWTELEGAALREVEPALAPTYRFGAFLPDGAQCTDPGAYVAAIVAHAVALGVTRIDAAATGFEAAEGRVTAVTTTRGPVACAQAVIAAGIASAPLARRAGDRVLLEAERGYHVQIDQPGIALRRPVMPSDGKMANTMIGTALRASGQVELSHATAAPNWHRADILLDHLRRSYDGLDIDPARVRRWQGNRPSTPDGLPVIGPAALRGVFHAFGHGHVGLNAGPKTAALVADLIEGRAPLIDPAPYSVRRFA